MPGLDHVPAPPTQAKIGIEWAIRQPKGALILRHLRHA
jgi:hypothetical protein